MNSPPFRERLSEGTNTSLADDVFTVGLLRAYPAPPRLDASRVVAIRERLIADARRGKQRKAVLAAALAACAVALVVVSFARFLRVQEYAIVVVPEPQNTMVRRDLPRKSSTGRGALLGDQARLTEQSATLSSGTKREASEEEPTVSRRAANRVGPSPDPRKNSEAEVHQADVASSTLPADEARQDLDNATKLRTLPLGSTSTVTTSAPPIEAVVAPVDTQTKSATTSEPTHLERESAMLADALGALRRERSPEKAIAKLNRYDEAFPRGSLRGEASVARVDALLALGRNQEALNQLQRLSIMSLPRGNELRVVRAELSARQGRCDAAIADANAALSQATNSALATRAKLVLANCATQ